MSSQNFLGFTDQYRYLAGRSTNRPKDIIRQWMNQCLQLGNRLRAPNLVISRRLGVSMFLSAHLAEQVALMNPTAQPEHCLRTKHHPQVMAGKCWETERLETPQHEATLPCLPMFQRAMWPPCGHHVVTEDMINSSPGHSEQLGLQGKQQFSAPQTTAPPGSTGTWGPSIRGAASIGQPDNPISCTTGTMRIAADGLPETHGIRGSLRRGSSLLICWSGAGGRVITRTLSNPASTTYHAVGTPPSRAPTVRWKKSSSLKGQ